MDDQMSEKEFRKTLLTLLDAGHPFERAMAIFRSAGPDWGLQLVNALSHAVDKGVLAETLQLLDRYFQERPMNVTEASHRIEVFVNPRRGVFLRIDGRSTAPL